MSITDNLIKERVAIAKAILNAGLGDRDTDLDADPSFSAEPLCSQYVKMRVGGEGFIIRVADHARCKPSDLPAIDTFRTPVEDVIAAINLIAANREKFIEIYAGDFDETIKAIRKQAK